MSRLIIIAFIISFTSLFINGCSYVGIGNSQTYCQENGCDYADAGVCGDTYMIYKNNKKVNKVAYKDFIRKKIGDEK